MPSVTLNPEADVATWSSGIAAGAGLHLPIGNYGGANYRSAIRFPVPSGWLGWTSITKATLNIYISDFNHVGPRNSSIYCRHEAVSAGLWTKAEGTQSCESGFSGSNTTQYSDLSPTSTDQVTFSSGTTENAKKALIVTALVDYYWSASAAKIVFVFDEVGSSDYTELWSRNKGGSYAMSLVIDYTDNAVPTAPTLTAPVAGAVSVTTTPTLDWTHNDPDGDPQASAQVRMWDAAGTTQLGSTITVTGTSSALVWSALTRGTSYQWDVRTADATGYGPWSAKRAFSIKALPVVTITPTRYMVFAGTPGAPRLQVRWSVNQPQGRYRVQVSSPAFDSGWLTGAATSYTLATQPVVDNVAQSITVSVENTDGAPGPLVGTATRSFTPRYGLTVHRRDLGVAPAAWGSPLIVSTVPTDATLKIEYGSSATATAAPSPNTWYSTLSSAPRQRYVFWRAWFIPSATAGPTLDRIAIVSSNAVAVVDKWGTTRDTPGLVAPWSIDPYEYVYGTRSLSADVSGAGPFTVSSYGIKVLAGRSYILTGLMKTDGNAGAVIRLQDAASATLTSPTGALISVGAPADAEWFTADQRDVNRYKTPVWVAPNDMTVWVICRVGGTAGSKAWFDGIKLEESTVATPWAPGAVGATIVDAGGIQVDGNAGGVLRYRGTTGGDRDLVQGGARGLRFGPDTEIWDNGNGELFLQNANGNNILRVQGVAGEAAGVYSAFLANRGGDIAARMVMGYSGDVGLTGIFVGSGAAARDVNLYRSGNNEWTTDDALKVGGLFSPQAGRQTAVFYHFAGTIANGTSTLLLTPVGSTVGAIPLPYNGRVVGIAVSTVTARSAGTATAQWVVNNTVRTTPAAVIDGTNTQRAYDRQSYTAASGGAWSAGAFAQARIITSGFAPLSNPVYVDVMVVFDDVAA